MRSDLPSHVIVIPKGATLYDVRTGEEPGHRFPLAMRIVAREKPGLYLFEYRDMTLYAPFGDPFMELTMAVEPVYGLS